MAKQLKNNVCYIKNVSWPHFSWATLYTHQKVAGIPLFWYVNLPTLKYKVYEVT